MTNRLQILRSSTPGQVPAAGTRQPGELWTTFPDLQLGVVDASKTAQKLIAVRFFSVSANYAAGDFVVQAGKLYFATGAVTAGSFNAGQWTQVAALTDIPALYVLPTASTSVLGGVKIDGTTITIASGVISSAGLVTVSATAPSPVQNGALWYDLVGGQLYAWVNDGTSSQWVVAVNQSLGGVYLPMTGGVLTGPLTLAADPVNPLDASTKQYVDASLVGVRYGDNRIINGDMRIDQRNNGVGGTAAGYTVDRWGFAGSPTGKGTWGRAASVAPGFPYHLSFASSSAYSVLAGDYFAFNQAIEADMVSDFQWGSANAQPVTLSFWVASSLTGTFGGAVQNYGSTRSYPFTYSIPVANTWTKIVLTIPGDTTGTWVMSGNAGSVTVFFSFGMGTTRSGPANAWAAANYLSAAGAVSVVGTNGAIFYVTGVKLEIGSVATPFNRQSLTKSMADCQRYYQQFQNIIVSGYAVASGAVYTEVLFPVAMRAIPTVVYTAPTYLNASALSANIIDGFQMQSKITITATGAGYGVAAPLTASAEL